MAKIFIAFGDNHYPHQSASATECLKKVIAHIKPHITISLGDLVDGEAFSSHARGAIGEAAHDYITHEIEPANAFLDFVQRYSRDKTICIGGNHEHRVERWCATNCGKLDGLINNAISPQTLISRGRRAFAYVPYIANARGPGAHYAIAPDLVAVHGWSCARNAAQRHLDLSRTKSVLFGHTHRAQTERSRDPWTGHPIIAMSAGCLCDLQPTYLSGGTPSAWTHGFILGFLGRQKNDRTIYVVDIIDGRAVLPSGKEIKI